MSSTTRPPRRSTSRIRSDASAARPGRTPPRCRVKRRRPWPSPTSGDYVVVWTGRGPGDIDGGIFFQRYNAAGVPQGVETLVNTTTGGVQTQARVAMHEASGAFVVVWSGLGTGDTDGGGIFYRRFDAAGLPLGSETIANTSTVGASRRLRSAWIPAAASRSLGRTARR